VTRGERIVLASVIIPTRNRGATLRAIVLSLATQTVGPRRFEIVIVDNASTDDTRHHVERLRAVCPSALRYHRMDADRGPAAARNAGARLAAGEALMFLDSDVEPDPGWIETAVDYLLANPRVGIVAGKLLYASRPTHINMFGGELSRIGLAWDANEGDLTASVQARVERLWAPSSALMVRRDLFEQIGPFDDSFYFGFEDSDLGWRANLAGFGCVCLPDLIALHRSTPAGRTAGDAIVFHYTKNRVRSMLKNYSHGNLARYLSLYLLYSAAEMIARPSRRARVRALAWNLANLRDTWRERHRVQALRKCSDAELFPYFSSRLLPAKTLARRRTEEAQLLRSTN
jgi:GT2 family glycosyltransferase